METLKRKLPFTFPAIGENNKQQNDGMLDMEDLGTVVERPLDGKLGTLFPKFRDPAIPDPVAPCRQLAPSTKSGELRPIVIDGGNVARSHGRPKRMYSAKGIQICIDYFHQRGHKAVAVVSGSRRYSKTWNTFPEESQRLLEKLHDEGLVIFTPSTRLITGKQISIYDDRLILSKAVEGGGVVVSNDRYRDLYHEKEAYRDVIDNRVLRYRFSGDIFIPFSFRFGSSGPTLDQFLRIDGGAMANGGQQSSLPREQRMQHPAAKRRKVDTTQQHYNDSEEANQQAISDEDSISELCTQHPDAEFVIVDIAGSSQFPHFTMRVTVNDMMYEGSGPSKEEAKLAAARNALIQKGGRPKETVSKTVKSQGSSSRHEKPISNLRKLHPDAEFAIVNVSGSCQFPFFTMTVTVKDMVYEGRGRTKKEAKQAAARKALKQKGGFLKPVVKKPEKLSKSNPDDLPVRRLRSLHSDVKFTPGKTPALSFWHSMKVTVKGMTFEGSGATRREATEAAARNALKELMGEKSTEEEVIPVESDSHPPTSQKQGRQHIVFTGSS